MKRLIYYILFSVTLITVSCQGELFPLEEAQPLILEPTPDFKATELNPLCEINYFEENLSRLYDAKLPMENHPFYKAIEEWNKAQSNVKFKFQRDLNKCNMQILANDKLSFSTIIDQNELGIFKFNNTFIDNTIFWRGLVQINKNLTALCFSSDALYKDINSPNAKRILMYSIGRYLGLPDSKDRNSYMFPYLIKDGTQGRITDEDIGNFKKLHPNVCGKVDVGINSYSVNTNGSVNFSVKYNTTSSVKSTILACGVVIGEDSVDLTLEKKSYYIFNDSGTNGDTFSGKIDKLNSRTKHYAKAFVFDANGVTYGDKIISFTSALKLHDTWERIVLPQEVNVLESFAFEYKGKLFLGLTPKNNRLYLNIYDLTTQKLSQRDVGENLTFDSFYSDGYIYSLKILDNGYGSGTLDEFYRLNVDNFVWEKLRLPYSGEFRNTKYGNYIRFSNSKNLYFTLKPASGGFDDVISIYDITKNRWTVINIGDKDKVRFSSSILRNYKPYYKDGAFYFMNGTSRTIFYDDMNTAFSFYYITKTFLGYDSFFPKIPSSYYGYYLSNLYLENSSLMTYFQGNFIKLFPPGKVSRNIRIGEYYGDEIYLFSSNINEALASKLYNVDRQLFLNYNLQQNTCTGLTSPPQEFRDSFFLDNISPNSFILSDDKNIYVSSSTTNTFKYIWKYIP